jgi:hypothetical protein
MNIQNFSMETIKGYEMINTTKYVFAYVVGTAYKIRLLSRLCNGETIPCVIYHDDKTGLVNAYLADENGTATINRIGRIIEQNDTAYSGANGITTHGSLTNSKLFINVCEAMSADDFVKAFGSKSVIGTVVFKVEGNSDLVMIRIDDAVKIDLSHFSTEDAKRVQERLDYLATLNVSAETCKDLQMAMVRCLYDHKNISEFKPTYINVDNKVEMCVKHVLLLKQNLAFVGNKGAGRNDMLLHLASLMDLQLPNINNP